MADHLGTPAPLVVVMGVSAVGKSTVGALLASRFGVEYADADAFHPQSNIDKMSAGVPLTDEDRLPWLAAIGRWLHDRRETGGVMSCSALKRAYRDLLVQAAPGVRFLHLHGDPDVVRARIAQRTNHFMPPSLVDAQLAALEPLEPDEPGVAVDLRKGPGEIVDAFLSVVDRSH